MVSIPRYRVLCRNLACIREVSNLEAQARQQRLACFQKHLEINKDYVAHHANDQVETYLFRLFRDGVLGLAGMAPSTTVQSLRIMRPWLCQHRTLSGVSSLPSTALPGRS